MGFAGMLGFAEYADNAENQKSNNRAYRKRYGLEMVSDLAY
jgi:hypothetical protein